MLFAKHELTSEKGLIGGHISTKSGSILGHVCADKNTRDVLYQLTFSAELGNPAP